MKRITSFMFIAATMLLSCQNKSKQSAGCENMPEFEKRFPEKTVVTSDGNTAFTFSSMEEAEWKDVTRIYALGMA